MPVNKLACVILFSSIYFHPVFKFNELRMFTQYFIQRTLEAVFVCAMQFLNGVLLFNNKFENIGRYILQTITLHAAFLLFKVDQWFTLQV
jgi:hypothetical protein